MEVDAHPESRVHNSQPHGIGRVVALGGLWAWNNLGRNVVFAGEDLRPRAVFDESVFSDDEPSQYDLDVHAIADVPSVGIVVMLNHLGMVRAFSSDVVRQPGRLRRVDPMWTRTFASDVERMVVLGDRIVGSRPREDGAPGLLVSERLSAQPTPDPLEMDVRLETIGMVTALVAIRGRRGGVHRSRQHRAGEPGPRDRGGHRSTMVDRGRGLRTKGRPLGWRARVGGRL